VRACHDTKKHSGRNRQGEAASASSARGVGSRAGGVSSIAPTALLLSARATTAVDIPAAELLL
jgi:hypothetical protein